jgi:hypothetical protein
MTTRYIADPHGGTCGNIIVPVKITGYLQIGHTFDLSDPAAPIWTDPAATVYPDAPYGEGRCETCVAKVSIGRLGGGTLMVLEHAADCRWLTEILQLSGLSS